MSEAIVFAAFFGIALTGHKIGAFLEKHQIFGASGHHFPRFIGMLPIFFSAPVRETMRDYAVHFIVYSQAGVLSALGLHH